MVFAGRHAGIALEDAGKVLHVPESDDLRDRLQLEVGVGEKPFGPFDPVAVDEVRAACAGFTGEESTEEVLVQAEIIRELLDPRDGSDVFYDIFADFGDLVCSGEALLIQKPVQEMDPLSE